MFGSGTTTDSSSVYLTRLSTDNKKQTRRSVSNRLLTSPHGSGHAPNTGARYRHRFSFLSFPTFFQDVVSSSLPTTSPLSLHPASSPVRLPGIPIQPGSPLTLLITISRQPPKKKFPWLNNNKSATPRSRLARWQTILWFLPSRTPGSRFSFALFGSSVYRPRFAFLQSLPTSIVFVCSPGAEFRELYGSVNRAQKVNIP